MGFFDLDEPHYNFKNFDLDDVIRSTINFLEDKQPDGTHERAICHEVRWHNDIKALMRHLDEDNFETVKQIYMNRYQLIEAEDKAKRFKSSILPLIGTICILVLIPFFFSLLMHFFALVIQFLF